MKWRKHTETGASAVELTIAIPLLSFFLFGFVEFALWYGTSAMVRQAAIEGINYAATSTKIGSSDEEQIEALKNEVDQKAKEFVGMFLVNPEGEESGVASLISDEGTGRAFELVIPTPAEGETLSSTLLYNPLGVDVSYTYRGILYGSFRTLMGGNPNQPVRVYTHGYAENATPPAKDKFYDPCEKSGRDSKGPSEGSSTNCKYQCLDEDHGCPSGNCVGAGGECIPCPPNTVRSDNGQCKCALSGCTPGSPVYKPNEDCTACVCDAGALQADCDYKKWRVPNGSSCFGGPIDTNNCKCTPGDRCAVGSCNPGTPGQSCPCNPQLVTDCLNQNNPPGSNNGPWFFDSWPCDCRNCTDQNGTVTNGQCLCDTTGCQPPAQAIWWDEKCACKCSDDKGLEIDPEQSEEGKLVVCRCQEGFTTVPDANVGFRCECQVTCPQGTKMAETRNGCKCECDTGVTEGAICVLPQCSLANCENRHNEQYTGATWYAPNVLYDCDCGSSG